MFDINALNHFFSHKGLFSTTICPIGKWHLREGNIEVPKLVNVMFGRVGVYFLVPLLLLFPSNSLQRFEGSESDGSLHHCPLLWLKSVS